MSIASAIDILPKKSCILGTIIVPNTTIAMYELKKTNTIYKPLLYTFESIKKKLLPLMYVATIVATSAPVEKFLLPRAKNLNVLTAKIFFSPVQQIIPINTIIIDLSANSNGILTDSTTDSILVHI
ncbi:hypothetical protein IHI24_000894 [Rickettsia endosymbiont of Cardiosporidium cionae]|nr:hypothetical protein IHI24_000894 [Rickettsia endosymbiont of Cardiosporidium cionae]